MCTFCGLDEETITHVFWDCNLIQAFWNDLLVWLNSKCLHLVNFTFSQILVIFGYKESCFTDEVMDLIITLAKRFIFTCKIKKTRPCLAGFKNVLLYRFNIEKQRHICNGHYSKFIDNWRQYKSLDLFEPAKS